MLRQLILLGFLFVVSGARASSWEYHWAHPTPEGNAIHAFAFPSASRGYAVGLFGTVLRTDDGGTSWVRVQDYLTLGQHLYDVVALDTETLVAVGEGIFRSTDGGATFTEVLSGPAMSLRDVHEVPGGDLSAAGAGGAVWRSNDGGQSWTETGPHVGTIRRHTWTSATTGFVVGEDVAQRTTNGGVSWSSFVTPPAFGFNDVYFTGPLTGYAIDDFGLARTIDGGATWSHEPIFTSPVYRFCTLPFDASHWLLATFLEGAELWETFDAGENWSLVHTNEALGFVSVTEAPGGRIFWSSSNGDIFYSDDGVATVHNATRNLAASPGSPILAFYDRGDGTVFVGNQPSTGVSNESWFRSDDGGRSWDIPPATPGLRWVQAGEFATPDVGVVASYEDIRYTSDGGASWDSAALPPGQRVADVAALSPVKILASTYTTGGGGSLFASTDGGANWVPFGSGLPSMSMWAMAFSDDLHGWIGGTFASSHRLYRTTNGGANWSLLSATGLGGAPSDLDFSADGLHGVAAVRMGSSPGIYRTVDGGATWTLAAPGSVSQIDMRFDGVGVSTGVFSSEPARFTVDGGASWSLLEVPLAEPFELFPSSVTAVLLTGDDLLVGGSNNRILFGEGVETVGVEAPFTSSAGRITLAAPRPNPSFGSTTISYTLERRAAVEVAVYDARGRVVATLSQGEQGAGHHAAVWDGVTAAGERVSAGVYLVRVSAGSTSLGRKLVRVE